MKVFIGIDPGASGGLAEIGENYVKTTSMPATERDVWLWLEERGVGQDALGDTVFAVIEKVGGFIGGGVGEKGGGAANGSAMFKFGASFGGLRMAIIAAGIPFEEVIPRSWQKVFGIQRRPNETKTSFKNRLKAVAQSLFPNEKITLATADAILIAEYARRTHK